MGVEDVPERYRREDYFHHIDMGFVNRRLALTVMPAQARQWFTERANHGTDHFAMLADDHLLVTTLLDVCGKLQVPTLLEALTLGTPNHLFCSTERVAPCPEVYTAARVRQKVLLDIDFGKPVELAYHTKHLTSDTGKMTLAEGADGGFVESMVGILHDRGDRFEIEPVVIGAPWFDHPRNGEASSELMWLGQDYGEILPEDIEQFSRLADVTATAEEWMPLMKATPENAVKEAFARLLGEPTKKDWGGEANDHFSANVTVGGRRRTAAFLLKGPSNFREMTLDICGARADQIYRLVGSGADISIVQHSHLIGEVVRGTLRAMTVHPGRPRKYCLIDGQATFRILRAYGFV